jgi:hypothetical protein
MPVFVFPVIPLEGAAQIAGVQRLASSVGRRFPDAKNTFLLGAVIEHNRSSSPATFTFLSAASEVCDSRVVV